MPPEYLKLLLSHAECNVAYPMNRKSLQLVHIWVHNFYLCRTATRSTFICRLKKNFFPLLVMHKNFQSPFMKSEIIPRTVSEGVFPGFPALLACPDTRQESLTLNPLVQARMTIPGEASFRSSIFIDWQ